MADWANGLFRASPRASHALRTLQPCESASYVGRHSKSVWGGYHRVGGGATTGRGTAGLATRTAASCLRWARLAVSGTDGPSGALGSMDGRASSDSVSPARRSCLVLGGCRARRGGHAAASLQAESWEACLGWHAAYEGVRPQQPRNAGRASGRTAGSFTRRGTFTIATACCCRQLASRALLPSPCGAHAGAWLSAAPSKPALTLAPQAMQLALRRRLRLHLLLSPNCCGPSLGCGSRWASTARPRLPPVRRTGLGGCPDPMVPQQLLVHTTAPGALANVGQYGDHALACPRTIRTGLLARRAKMSKDRRTGLGARCPRGGWIRWSLNGPCTLPHRECSPTIADSSALSSTAPHRLS